MLCNRMCSRKNFRSRRHCCPSLQSMTKGNLFSFWIFDRGSSGNEQNGALNVSWQIKTIIKRDYGKYCTKVGLDIDGIFNKSLYKYQILQTRIREAYFHKARLLKPEYSISKEMKIIITYALKYFHLAWAITALPIFHVFFSLQFMSLWLGGKGKKHC